MTEISNTGNQSEPFRELMKSHSDEELKKILIMRRHYQPEAVKQAILEAINRGMIHSELDLQSEQFAESSTRSKFFPQIENPEVRNKIKNSISRSLMLAGLIPLVWSIAHWKSNDLFISILAIVYSLIWIGLATRLFQTQKIGYAYSLLILLVPALFYFVHLMLKNTMVPPYEIVVPVFLTAMIFYGVGYFRYLKD